MDREQAKATVKGYLGDYLRTYKGIDPESKKPFHCLNPEHDDAKPSMSYDPQRNRVKCFSCDASYDIFDLIQMDFNLSPAQAFIKGFELYNVTVDPWRPSVQDMFGKNSSGSNGTAQGATQGNIHNTQYTTQNTQSQKPRKLEALELTSVAEEAHAVLLRTPQALEHFTQRGLTLETIKAHKLGYDPEGYNSLLKAYPEQQSSGKKAVLYNYAFPVFDSSGGCKYIHTEISDRSQIDNYNGKYRKINGVSAPLYNEHYLASPETAILFVCEGIYDALSIEQQGGRAVALVGVGYNRLVTLCKKRQAKTGFVIALDSDEAGKKGAETLEKMLDGLHIPHITRQPVGGKDANEVLLKTPEALAEYVRQAIEDITDLVNTAEKEEKAEYLQTANDSHLQAFINGIQNSATAPYHRTGFPSLDKELDGGLYAGLYCIGAISSLGKTTFCLQIADNIAAAGTDVIIFSLEMAREELIAKSVSRLTYTEALRLYGEPGKAKTTRGILTGSRYKAYSQEERQLIVDSINLYSQYAGRIFVSVGIGNIGIEQIRETVEKHIRLTGRTPVIVIDYLQIIAPADPRSTDKQNTDKAVTELKRISRDFSTPVIGISSFNRDNYHAPVNLASFKESGAIEYSSDVLLGLQYAGMDYQEGESEKNREKRVRDLISGMIRRGKEGLPQRIQVKVLKNRNGSKGGTLLDFYPMFNYFEEPQSSSDGVDQTVGTVHAGGGVAARAEKRNARQELLFTLQRAFFAVEIEKTGTAPLEKIADELEVTLATTKRRLSEFSAFSVKDKTVSYADADKFRDSWVADDDEEGED